MSTQNRWVALKDQQPGEDQFPVSLGFWDEDDWVESHDWRHSEFPAYYTHWYSTKVDLPPPPRGEPTLAELDADIVKSILDQHDLRYANMGDLVRNTIAYERAEVARIIDSSPIGKSWSAVLKEIETRVKGNP